MVEQTWQRWGLPKGRCPSPATSCHAACAEEKSTSKGAGKSRVPLTPHENHSDHRLRITRPASHCICALHDFDLQIGKHSML